ncbi:MAG TPA: dihydrodipicolinate synthase family protein, partial [Xanthomonadaceae bacterium]|nr:dihydrodipicolinate synthase family protein [Xanthomonadaceae bacterium]
DIRRFAAIRALLGDRLELLVGMDDAIVEGVAMGAVGWIAGVVNAFPHESVRLYELAREGGADAAMDLYAWLLPLLRMDTVPKFVQLIKLMQERVDMGSERVRAPRLVVEGAERDAALQVIDRAIATRPSF